MSVTSICLNEWETKSPKPGNELFGLFLEENDEIKKIAKYLSNSKLIEINNGYKNGLHLKAFSFVGRLRLGNIQITIRPKISGLRLLHLLQYAYNLRDLKLFPNSRFNSKIRPSRTYSSTSYRWRQMSFYPVAFTANMQEFMKDYRAHVVELISKRSQDVMIRLEHRFPVHTIRDSKIV